MKKTLVSLLTAAGLSFSMGACKRVEEYELHPNQMVINAHDFDQETSTYSFAIYGGPLKETGDCSVNDDVLLLGRGFFDEEGNFIMAGDTVPYFIDPGLVIEAEQGHVSYEPLLIFYDRDCILTNNILRLKVYPWE